jgi:hypothetical protein
MKEAPMKRTRRNVVAALAVAPLLWSVALAGGVVLADAGTIERATALFKRYVALEQAYDPAAADLYSDDAVIKNKRTYPNGQVRELSMPALKYKALVRQAMPLARTRGDRSTYSDCKYQEVGERVRITCSRYSELKKYSSPLTLVVGPAARGEWLIFEELSESQP